MSRTKSEPQRPPAQNAELVKQYRAIGPAVLVAALLCTAKNRNAVKKPVKKVA
jgi:hypothetical protein